MTETFVENRIDDIKRIRQSLMEECTDPDSKGLRLREETLEVVNLLDKAIGVLRAKIPDLKAADSKRQAESVTR
jgi:hypothetical protein